jgi:sulfide:quinone oxidoreductase
LVRVNQVSQEQLEVVIAGGGVAGVEAALALRDMAGAALRITLLTPNPEFVYRPLTVREPFGFPLAQRYRLDEIARDLGLDLIEDNLAELDAASCAIKTGSGQSTRYDALVLALGAEVSPRFQHSITIDDRELDEQLHGLIQDVEAGYVHRMAFVAPSVMPWPLPLYELALMTARRAYDMNVELEITIVTPEDAPLAVFGTTASEGVARLLDEHHITTIASAHADVPRKGHVSITPGPRSLDADRIVALPQLQGPRVRGVPASPGGFISIDENCRVRDLERVWAAGDATDFPVKMGGIAAQQADIAAAEIAKLTGAATEPHTFQPQLQAVLLGGRRPLYLSAQLTGGHGTASEISETPPSSSRAKISARYLTPYLETLERAPGAAK